MANDEFEEIIHVVAFLAIVWICGRLCKFVKLSPLIGWIASGMIFGPSGIQLIGKHHEQVWQMLGTLGVTLLIAESGTHIHFDKVRKVGITAVFVAVIGTFLPLLSGFILVHLMGFELKQAFAAGCAMAPTSVSVALKLLCEANQLNSLPGQTIVTAAFLDDIFSIILLVVLEQFRAGNSEMSTTHTVLAITSKFIFCFLFLSIGVLFAMYFFTKIIPKLLHCIPSYDNINYQPRDELHLIIMIIILISYSYIGDKIGSHLLGAFIAGLSFSQVSRSMYVWRRQMKRLCSWLIRLFFACSVAFTVPIGNLLQIDAFLKGALIALVAGILGKMLSGFVAVNYKYVIGFAMVGRGEFAYLVAAKAKEWELVDQELYAIIVWSLLIAVMIAPIAFGFVLQKTFSHKQKSGIKFFIIKAEAAHHTGVHFEVVDVLHNLKLDILEAKVETDGDTDCSEFVVGVGDKDDIDMDKIHEILHDIREAIGSKAQIQLLQNISEMETDTLGGNGAEEDSTEYLLEIKLMTPHNDTTQIFTQIIAEMEANDIEFMSGHLDNFMSTDSQVIFGKILRNKTLDCRDLKCKFKNILKMNNISGEILCKKIRRDLAVLPTHIKFSDLLLSETNKSNPLLTNKIQNGYEIEICCTDLNKSNTDIPDLLARISPIFHRLDLETRTVHTHIDEEKQRFNSIFFVQEKGANKFEQNRRNNIESEIAKIFEQKGNIAATIKTKAIEMGKNVSDARNISIVIEDIDSGIEHQKAKNKNNNLRIDTALTDFDIDSPIDTSEKSNPLQRNLAAITESIVTITPKRLSALPPSIERGETAFVLVGLVDSDDKNNQTVLRQLTAIEQNSSKSNIESESSSTILDMLNEQ